MRPDLFTDPLKTINVIERLAAISVFISSLELLSKPAQLSHSGLLNWSVPKLRVPWLVNSWVSEGLDNVFSFPAVLYLIGIRLGAALALITGLPGSIAYVAVIALSSIALMLRTPFGNDGADQMSVLTFTALALGTVHPTLTAMRVCLWFIALQVCLSYATSGLAKLVAPGWRSGVYLIDIFKTTMYGNGSMARLLLKHPVLAKYVARLVVLTECIFPLVLFVPGHAAFWLIAGGISFHAMAAFSMGLNTFFWSFIAAYPAILYCHHIIAWAR